jgi:hypothetical protein
MPISPQDILPDGLLLKPQRPSLTPEEQQQVGRLEVFIDQFLAINLIDEEDFVTCPMTEACSIAVLKELVTRYRKAGWSMYITPEPNTNALTDATKPLLTFWKPSTPIDPANRLMGLPKF